MMITYPTWDKLRVLIAEDIAIEALSLKEMLENFGHIVPSVAKNGSEAVTLVKLVDPDLILMDIEMPDMNGIDASRIILGKQSLPIIITSAYTKKEYVDQLSQLGITAYLVKPFRNVDLLPTIKIGMDRFYERELLKEKVHELEEWRVTRKLLDQAKGILMDKSGMTEEEAHKWILKYSRDNCKKKKETAEIIIAGNELNLNGTNKGNT